MVSLRSRVVEPVPKPKTSTTNSSDGDVVPIQNMVSLRSRVVQVPVPKPKTSSSNSSAGVDVVVDLPANGSQLASDKSNEDSPVVTSLDMDAPSSHGQGLTGSKPGILEVTTPLIDVIQEGYKGLNAPGEGNITEDVIRRGGKGLNAAPGEVNPPEVAGEETIDEPPVEPIQPNVIEDNAGSDSENETMDAQSTTQLESGADTLLSPSIDSAVDDLPCEGIDQLRTDQQLDSRDDRDGNGQGESSMDGPERGLAPPRGRSTENRASAIELPQQRPIGVADMGSTHRKRKRSAGGDGDDELHAGSNSAIVIDDEDIGDIRTTVHHRKLRKVSVKKYASTENLWMGNTLEGIETADKDNEEALKLLEEQEEALEDFLTVHIREEIVKLLLKQKDTLVTLKDYILTCGAKESKITKKWERSV